MDYETSVATALIAGAVSLATSWLSVRGAEQRLRREFRLEFEAEARVADLLHHAQWRLRSFRVIKDYIGGFDDDELRRILVRAGAARFWPQASNASPDGPSSDPGPVERNEDTELWGLVERNKDRLSAKPLKGVPPMS